MPTLDFKGKQFVYSHHLSVPFRELKVVADKSLPQQGKAASLDDNLIIHGDNLEALKALLPTHAGKVDCVLIDPPYNTGGDWCYNDNVNSPLMKEWVKASANPVDKDDLERHDKWLCMMWPRLQLIRELLTDTGFIAAAIDENEIVNFSKLLDDVFGEENRIAICPWKAEPSGGKQKSGLRIGHEYILIYGKSPAAAINTDEVELDEKPLNDEKGTYFKGRELLKWGAGSLRSDRETMWYPLYLETGEKIFPLRNDGKEGRWRLGKENKYIKAIIENPKEAHWELRPFDGEGERWVPYEKIRELKKERVFGSWLDKQGTNADGTEEIKRIFGFKSFDTPKPVSLYEWLINLCPNDDGIILDSFAGSGTAGHAVLSMNKKDGGNRKFILIQMDEDIPEKHLSKDAGYNKIIELTLYRITRAIRGYEFSGSEKEILFEEKINWTSIKNGFHAVEEIEQSNLHRFSKFVKKISDNVFQLIGEKDVLSSAEALGGSFSYCDLGEPIQIESLLTGDAMPSFDALARYVFYTATGQSLETVAKASADGFIGETDLFRIHLFYRPDSEWLRSNEAALNADKVEAISKNNTAKKRTIVFAVAKFMSQKDLTEKRIEFCQLPYAIHRIMGA
ncbi:site-specific DNA-methyltransferase [Aeromonas veronii]|uniref:site-specific DNA-methyltransferase n=1 Tax=Aeromonas veronii TaxID=654 RepID=UPI001F1C1A02|nr:site-specific DNA-methyltransferase [Aeromonas veronii]MCF5873953.1 site-specific DNA-methyltransferase [Aeromonas veronii]MCX0436504.1 site-specific DNA-methyltransferase [Aeromonas veronii]